MAAGFQVTLAGLDAQLSGLVTSLRQSLENVNNMKVWLDSVGSGGLVGLGMASGDASIVISAFNDLNDLFTIYHGGASIHLTGTYDYTTFAKQLTAYT